MKKELIYAFRRIIVSVLVVATIGTSIPVTNYSYASELDNSEIVINEVTEKEIANDVSFGLEDIDETDILSKESLSEEEMSVSTEKAATELTTDRETVSDVMASDEEKVSDVITSDEENVSEEELAAIIREYDEISDSIEESRFLYEQGGEEIFEDSEEYIRLQELGGTEDSSADRLAVLDALIAEKFEAGADSITFTSKTYTQNEVYSAVTRVKNAHPEFFYISVPFNNINYQYDNGVFYATSLSVNYNTSYDITTFNLAINKAMSLISDDMSDLEKALVLHDFLVNNTCYNQQVANGGSAPTRDVYSAYGVLVNQDAVCNGYALAYQMLLNKAGVECAFITSSQLNHAWNYVKIDGYYYHVDTTWDDPVPNREGRSRHLFFLFSDSA